MSVGTTATIFATLINNTDTEAVDCRLSAPSLQGIDFTYSQTDPATNQVIGDPNPTLNIGPNEARSFVISVRPYIAITPGFVAPNFDCANKFDALVVNGVNTLLFSASDAPVPDVIAVAVTPDLNDGVLRISGNNAANAFSIATTNLGAADRIEVTPVAELRGGSDPLNLEICQTDPATGSCIDTPSASIVVDIEVLEAPTFAVFAFAQGAPVPFDPGENRIFLNFTQSGQTRGGTSVAVTTE